MTNTNRKRKRYAVSENRGPGYNASVRDKSTAQLFIKRIGDGAVKAFAAFHAGASGAAYTACCRCRICPHKPARAKQYAAEIARYHCYAVGKRLLLHNAEDGHSGSAGGFAVVGKAGARAALRKNICPAVMPCVGIESLLRKYYAFGFLAALYAGGKSNKARFIYGYLGICAFCYGEIAFHNHPASMRR